MRILQKERAADGFVYISSLYVYIYWEYVIAESDTKMWV